ncbi:ModD protein [Derxia lacustris]|uniref:ModD protein n=1 Tax=Derxia lacustris TaxID=764842 RepID=UPI000A171D21|nr:ModD protein [Derxia lacustris]
MQERALSDAALWQLLADDVPAGDLTTLSLAIGASPAHAHFNARRAMTVCGAEEAARMFELTGARAELLAASGDALDAGAPILVAHGTAGQLHRAWKAAQILVEWASGIATSAAAIVAAAEHEGRRLPVACTRKTAPGAKAMSVKAVRCAGARLHRLGLSESILVFAEHRAFLTEAPADTVARLRAQEPEKKLVVEVADPAEALRWAEAGADVLQLEKFPPAAVAETRRLIDAAGLRASIAAAGGVKADNAGAYVAAGADFLVTSAPYTAPPADVAVRLGPSAGAL